MTGRERVGGKSIDKRKGRERRRCIPGRSLGNCDPSVGRDVHRIRRVISLRKNNMPTPIQRLLQGIRRTLHIPIPFQHTHLSSLHTPPTPTQYHHHHHHHHHHHRRSLNETGGLPHHSPLTLVLLQSVRARGTIPRARARARARAIARARARAIARA